MNKFVPLKDLCLSITDCPHESPKWLKNGYARIIRNFNLVNGQIIDDDSYFVDKETFLARTKRAIPEEGDIIFSREAPIGNCAIVPKNFKCCLGQRLVLLKVNRNIVSSEYLLVALLSKFVKYQIEQVAKRGSIVSNFNISDLSELKIPVLNNQDKIANLSNIISNKINTNNKIITELESMAKTIYDYWFLQFEFPNEERKPYKSSGGKMVWNEELKREIPEGWKVGKLIENVNFTQGYPFSSNNYSDTGNFKLYTIKNVQDGYIDTNVDNKITMIPENMDRNCLLKPGDIIMSLTGNVGRVAQVFENNALLNQRVLKISPSTFGESFLYLMLRSDYLQSRFKLLATGTSQKNLSPIDLGKEKIIVPSSIILSLFEKNTKALNRTALKLKKENQELTSLRDFLLPLLMNGQVGFKDEKK